MRIFVFEFITGGGMFGDPAPGTTALPQRSLLAEGRAMVQAITADLLAIPDTVVCAVRDARLPPLHPPGCDVAIVHSSSEARDHFLRLAAASDWALLIAPELDGALLDRARLVEFAGGQLLSPGPSLIEIAACKQRTADWLGDHQVPVPFGQIVAPHTATGFCDFPAVLKPADGCGSQDVRLIRSHAELAVALSALDRPMRLEQYIPGLAASVALLCGPLQRLALPACQQRLSDDGHFKYLGGRTPLPGELDQRARRLALAAVATLPDPIGYLGVDLVLGDNPNGSGDRVIEVNPRLTTSYVGLRAACRENLAAAMLAIAAGQPATLSFHSGPVEFDADGTLRGPANS